MSMPLGNGPVPSTGNGGTPPSPPMRAPAPPSMVTAEGLGFSSGVDDGHPVLLFNFSGEVQFPIIKLRIPPEELKELPGWVKDAVEGALLHSGYTERPDVRCSGCGLRLFGDLVDRGVCKSCKPDDDGGEPTP